MVDRQSHSSHETPPPAVLVVDDEPSLRTIVTRWLSDAGYRCGEARNAPSAIDYMTRHDVHVVTLDATAAGDAGLDLLGQIKRRWPETEVVVSTTAAEISAGIQSMTLGAYGYLTQPVDRDEMVFLVRQAMERRRSALQTRRYISTLEDKVREQVSVIRHAHEETILRLVSASRYRDEETGAHIRRTGLYCELFAQVLGWSTERVENLRMAAPMHDLGKIGIPDAILKKPGRLTPAEFDVMKTHTLIGAAMLDGSESEVLQLAHDIAMCHHERWDGLGYPRGLVGAAAPEAARILAVVDVYDALTHRRVYHEALPEEQTLAIMEEGRGKHFDPFLFGVFLSLVPEMRRIALANPDESSDDPFESMLSEAGAWSDRTTVAVKA